jgi:hypothetical protein
MHVTNYELHSPAHASKPPSPLPPIHSPRCRRQRLAASGVLQPPPSSPLPPPPALVQHLQQQSQSSNRNRSTFERSRGNIFPDASLNWQFDPRTPSSPVAHDATEHAAAGQAYRQINYGDSQKEATGALNSTRRSTYEETRANVFPDHHKWAFDPPEPPAPLRGQSPPSSPSKTNKPPFLSPQKFKNHFLQPVDNAAIWQQEVNVAGKVTGVYMPIIRRQPGSDIIPSYLDDSRADNECISSIPKSDALHTFRKEYHGIIPSRRAVPNTSNYTSNMTQLLTDGPERPPPSRHSAPIDVCTLLNRDCFVYLLRKKKLLCQTLARIDREGKSVLSLAQFRQALHASDALVYLDILSPSWKMFVAQHDHHASKVDVTRLLTVLEHGEADSSVLRSMTHFPAAAGTASSAPTSTNARATFRVQPPRVLQDHAGLPNTIRCIIRGWRRTISPIRLQLQPQLHVHDAPLSLADLTRIALDAGEKIGDADAQVLLNFGHLEMTCSRWLDFICSEDVDIEVDAKRLKQLKRRLVAVVYKPVFISRVQHLPSFRNGIVPLDSLVRVLLSSTEFEPRLTSDDLRVLVAGLQPHVHTHSFSHGGEEKVIDWTEFLSALLQDMKEEQQESTAKHPADNSSSVAVVVNGQPSVFHSEMNADPSKHIVHLNRNKDDRRFLKETKFKLHPDDDDRVESTASASERVIAAIQNAVRSRGIQYKATFDDMTGGRGSVGVHQLQQTLQQQGCSITKEDAAAVVHHFDSDGDGLLTFADFTRLMQTTCDSHSASSATDDDLHRPAPRPFLSKAFMSNTSGSTDGGPRGAPSTLDASAALRFGKAIAQMNAQPLDLSNQLQERLLGVGGSMSARGFERQDRLTFNMREQAVEKGLATARRHNSMRRDYDQAQAVMQRLRDMEMQQQQKADERINSYRQQQQRYNEAALRESDFALKYQRK